ncbi:cyclic nucleotide-binding domain-containing protein [Konateibacter massiliensis]|uniref:cyclic nucleotide-binding domain-containing protein n=1 Tax=Konateibacter massiliensis TaxID=2002841 RepID=UPI0015D46E4C|nr:cyclic nucleotide-binding domain-containing protein [Konateibacter massiliensis]
MERIYDKALFEKIIREYPIEEALTDYKEYPIELVLFKKGEHLFKYGEPLAYICFFISGRAKVYSLLANGKHFLHTFYHQFELIGDIEFVNRLDIRTNVQALTEVYCLLLPLNECHARLYDDRKFLRAACSHLASKLDSREQLNSHNIFYPLEERLASYIINTSDGLVFHENLTSLSELLGTSYRHLLRTLKDFCDRGYLEKENGVYKITAPNALKTLGADIYMNYY